MRTHLICGILCVSAAAAGWAGPEPKSSGRLPAGAVLDGAPLAGEAKALDYLKSHEPDAYRKLTAMPPAKMRQVYGDYFIWFQRAGASHMREKTAMVRKIKEHLRMVDVALASRSTQDPREKARLRAELEKWAADIFEEDLSLLDRRVSEMRGTYAQLRQEIEALEKRVADLRASKDEIIAARVKVLEDQAVIEQRADSNCEDFSTCFNTADLLVKSGDCFEAVHALGRAAEYQSDNPWPWYERALIRGELGDEAGAEADFARALAVGAGNPDFVTRRKPADGSRPDFHFMYGPTLRCSAASQKKGRDLGCRDYASCYRAGGLLVSIGDCAGAARAFGEAGEYKPKNPWPWYQRSIIRRELDDSAGADADLARAVSLEAGSPDFKRRAKPSDGRPPDFQFVHGSQQLCVDSPLDKDSDCRSFDECYNRVHDLMAKGDCAAGVKSYGQAMRFHPRNPWPWYHRSILRRELGDAVGADSDYARALALGEDDPDFRRREVPPDGSRPTFHFVYGPAARECDR
ncbi:MAG: hypothetical protein WC728_03590 [Elusimicrobiota bacterium]